MVNPEDSTFEEEMSQLDAHEKQLDQYSLDQEFGPTQRTELTGLLYHVAKTEAYVDSACQQETTRRSVSLGHLGYGLIGCIRQRERLHLHPLLVVPHPISKSLLSTSCNSSIVTSL